MIGRNSRSVGPPFHQALIPPGSWARIEAKIRSEMPFPMPRFVISSPIHMSRVVAAVRETTISTIRPAREREGVLPVEEVRVAEGLQRGQDDGEVAGVLVDLGVARLAFLLELLEARDDDGEELQDDRRRDVRHDPEREERELGQRAAREDVEQGQDRPPLPGQVVLD